MSRGLEDIASNGSKTVDSNLHTSQPFRAEVASTSEDVFISLPGYHHPGSTHPSLLHSPHLARPRVLVIGVACLETGLPGRLEPLPGCETVAGRGVEFFRPRFLTMIDNSQPIWLLQC